jgi:hypothetical protein
MKGIVVATAIMSAVSANVFAPTDVIEKHMKMSNCPHFKNSTSVTMPAENTVTSGSLVYSYYGADCKSGIKSAAGYTLGGCVSADGVSAIKFTGCAAQGDEVSISFTSCTSADCSTGCSSFSYSQPQCDAGTSITCSSEVDAWKGVEGLTYHYE